MTPEERLAAIRKITDSFPDEDEYFAHGDCPVSEGDGEDYRVWLHHADCHLKGQIGKIGDAAPDVECCDPDDAIDVNAALEACECGRRELVQIRKLATMEPGS